MALVVGHRTRYGIINRKVAVVNCSRSNNDGCGFKLFFETSAEFAGSVFDRRRCFDFEYSRRRRTSSRFAEQRNWMLVFRLDHFVLCGNNHSVLDSKDFNFFSTQFIWSFYDNTSFLCNGYLASLTVFIFHPLLLFIYFIYFLFVVHCYFSLI